MSELRWNPLLGEWVATATHRQDRTFLPPKDFCPLCPTKKNGFPTEIPEKTYDIVVFENRFPSLKRMPGLPAVEDSDLYPVEPGQGLCEVILYSPDHNTSLAEEPISQIEKLVRVWTDRFFKASSLSFVDYVFIFENKGEEIGVTIHHPHGQLYGYPFIPPKIKQELDQCRQHMNRLGTCLICDIIKEEFANGQRIIDQNKHFVAYIPFFARWPYEVHIASKKHLQALTDLSDVEQKALAKILKSITSAYDKLFDKSFPYMMVLHQRPTDGDNYDYYHFHIEFYPPMRAANKLKYLAGSETGAGVFINDTLAEDKAKELRKRVRKPSKVGASK
ncbi:MAG: galactose-1-phosphate uridylyltransferase [Candidatus Obscuribacterales bacterium]|nr:galactose-1-phosphate uridylyltransferase [Candidatus Obscuribacterales bacterium]